MDGLLSLLIFAGLFYLMMRFGCGAHMLRGHNSDKPDTEYTDPVCHMKVESDQGYGMMYKGALVRFCSRKCMDKFELEPALYLNHNNEEDVS